ncbi:MAG: hypothetical protein ACPG8W_16940, partial [Candidatus Promineifilaceae bacterium]
MKRSISMLLAVSSFLLFFVNAAYAAPDPLEFVGSLPLRAGEGEIQGDYLYLLRVGGLTIANVSNPSSPNIVGSVDFPTKTDSFGLGTGDIAVDGNLLTAVGRDGIVIIDINNKAQPEIVGVHAAKTRFTRTLELDYPIVYFDAFFPLDVEGMSGRYGLQAVDISDPANTQFLSGFPSPVNPPACNSRGCSPQFFPYTANLIELDQGFLRVYLQGRATGHLLQVDISNPNAIESIESEKIDFYAWQVHFDNDIIYATTGSRTVFSLHTDPVLSWFDTSPANNGAMLGRYTDCTLVDELACPSGRDYFSILYDLEVIDGIAYTVTPNELRIYDVSNDVSEAPITNVDDPRILGQYPEYIGRHIVRDSEYLYILGDDVKIVRYATDDTEPPTNDLSFEVSQGASRSTLPPSGAHVSFDVMTANTSPASQWMYPIQVTRYSADTVGEIAPNSQSWTNNCWWWLPKLWRTGTWTCNYSTVAPSNSLGNSFSSTVLVEASAENGDTFNPSKTTNILYAEGPGVGNVAYWQANPDLIYSGLAQYVDGDGNGSLETYGYLIGDTNFNGRCDQYEVWWTSQCVAVSADTASQFIWESDATDNRYTLTRELMAAWLNIRSNNDYLCAQADTAINLSLIWLHQNAPDGNPYLGGAPVTGAAWDEFSWNADWLNWYSETGGQNCALDIDTGSRNLGRSSAEFEPPTPASQAFSLATLAEVDRALSQDVALRDTVNNLYTETMALILQKGTVPADYLSRLESAFNNVVGAVDASAAAELQEIWTDLNPSQYANQSARSSWDRANIA